MNFTKKHYVLAEGLHSGALRENILKWLSKCQYEIPQQTFDKTEVKSFTTLSGDVHTSSQHDLTAKDTYIIQLDVIFLTIAASKHYQNLYQKQIDKNPRF